MNRRDLLLAAAALPLAGMLPKAEPCCDCCDLPESLLLAFEGIQQPDAWLTVLLDGKEHSRVPLLYDCERENYVSMDGSAFILPDGCELQIEPPSPPTA